MEQAKSAINKLTSHHGHHETTVHEHHQPSVTHEHVTPTRHDEGTTVVDREVHQDHYHTNVQPIHHREVLPEQHKHKLLPTEQKEFHHGDDAAVKQRLAGEADKYHDATETGATQYTKSAVPEVHGEHVHHHIHETIQPVVQKETIQPTVVHTTKPIHEVHHNAAQHHSTTVLPAVNLTDFKQHGGSLTGAKDRVTHYEGEPDASGTIGDARHAHHTGGTDRTGHSSSTGTALGGPSGRVTNDDSTLHRERLHEGHSGATANTVGAIGEGRREELPLNQKMDPRVDSRQTGIGSDRDTPIADAFSKNESGIATDRNHPGREPGLENIRDHPQHAGSKHEPPSGQFADTHLGSGRDGNAIHTSNFEAANIRHGQHETEKKPSLLDKLNPMKDADGDGKKGIMK